MPLATLSRGLFQESITSEDISTPTNRTTSFSCWSYMEILWRRARLCCAQCCAPRRTNTLFMQGEQVILAPQLSFSSSEVGSDAGSVELAQSMQTNA